MHIYPAIDLLDGQCVRLRQGDYADKTVFSSDPVEVARRWQAAGADRLHMVDLDGAKAGRETAERWHDDYHTWPLNSVQVDGRVPSELQ